MEKLQGRCQWVVSSTLLPTSRAASAEKSLSFKRKEKGRGKKEKEILLIEGFSINVSCRKGIIFSAQKRPFHLFFQPFSSCHRCRYHHCLLSLFRGISQSLSSSGKSSRTYRRVFPVVFLRHVLAMVAAIVVGILLRIDNARDAVGIRPSIIVEDKSVWWRVSGLW